MKPTLSNLSAAAVVLCACAWIVAQWQVNPRVERRVDNSLYGAGTAPSIKYSRNTSVAMPSEVRNAEWRSGALPSEIAMNRAAIGPLPAAGNIAYVPPQPTWTQVHKNSTKFSPPPQGHSAYLTGSVKHANVGASSNQIVMTPISTSVNTGLTSPSINTAFKPSTKTTGWTTRSTGGGSPNVGYSIPTDAKITMPDMSGSIRHP